MYKEKERAKSKLLETVISGLEEVFVKNKEAVKTNNGEIPRTGRADS